MLTGGVGSRPFRSALSPPMGGPDVLDDGIGGARLAREEGLGREELRIEKPGSLKLDDGWRPPLAGW